MNDRLAISKINNRGLLLVFPLANQPEPRSLWSEFHPRTRMRWEWDDSGDSKTFEMWALMKRLSDCREVVYSKWYQGRATFISRALFSAMLTRMRQRAGLVSSLDSSAALVLEILENNSPLSTRQLKEMAELQGRENEAAYNRALKALFMRLLVVGFGEVDEGSFPSLAVGATRLLYEELWNEAEDMTGTEANSIIDRHLPAGSHYRKFFDKTLNPPRARMSHRS